MYLVTDEKLATKHPQDTKRSWRSHEAIVAVIGFVGNFVRGNWSLSHGPARKRMHVIETMALGAKKQLLLVSCDGERFLVGTGPDQVHTIVRLGSDLETSEVGVVAVASECV